MLISQPIGWISKRYAWFKIWRKPWESLRSFETRCPLGACQGTDGREHALPLNQLQKVFEPIDSQSEGMGSQGQERSTGIVAACL